MKKKFPNTTTTTTTTPSDDSNLASPLVGCAVLCCTVAGWTFSRRRSK
jgi:hypothetical protein